MNILFLTLLNINDLAEPSLYSDLMREISRHGHNVYVASASEKRNGVETFLDKQEYGYVLHVKTGNIQKTNLIEKGISTILLESHFTKAIKDNLADVKFDLVTYSTPPVTLAKAVEFVKKRDGAKTYLFLKDIFPQNSVDLGLLKTTGPKAVIYKFFKAKEKKLYELSDKIGCMSPANCEFLSRQEPWIDKTKIEVNPNTEEPRPIVLSDEEKALLRGKYGVPTDKRIFVYGGNLGRPQCVSVIKECIEKCKDQHFLIVGSGTDRYILEEFVKKENPSNLTLLNTIPKEDYEKLTVACDVGLIFLDYRFTIPNFPSRLLTYLQAGLPVLCCTDESCDMGKIASENGFGWSCKSKNYDEFVSLAKSIDAMPTRMLKDMGNAGNKYFNEHYTSKISYEILERELNV